MKKYPQIRKTWDALPDMFQSDQTMQRLTSVLTDILGVCRNKDTMKYHFETDSFSALEGFNLNVNSKLNRMLLNMPVLKLEGNALQLVLPEFQIPQTLKFPGKSFRCVMTAAFSLFRLRDGYMHPRPELQVLEVNKTMAKVGAHEFNFSIPDGCLCIVTLSLDYFRGGSGGWKSINSTRFSPACICGAFVTPGTYNGTQKRWIKMQEFD